MTEEQAMARLKERLSVYADRWDVPSFVCDEMAEDAWNEMKAIAREDMTKCRRLPPEFFAKPPREPYHLS